MNARARSRTKRLIRIAYFAALTTVGAFIRIPAGPVVFSMQSYFVILSGLVIGASDGFAAQVVYMILGLIGVPIFTQGGGPSYVLQPSFGYILGFSLGAFLTGTVMKRVKRINSGKVWLAGAAGLVPMYAVGMAYQVMILSCVAGMAPLAAAATLVTMPFFLLFDFVVVFLTALVYPGISKLIDFNRPRDTLAADKNRPPAAEPRTDNPDSLQNNANHTDNSVEEQTALLQTPDNPDEDRASLSQTPDNPDEEQSALLQTLDNSDKKQTAPNEKE